MTYTGSMSLAYKPSEAFIFNHGRAMILVEWHIGARRQAQFWVNIRNPSDMRYYKVTVGDITVQGRVIRDSDD
jgi:hypothetical protein